MSTLINTCLETNLGGNEAPGGDKTPTHDKLPRRDPLKHVMKTRLLSPVLIIRYFQTFKLSREEGITDYWIYLSMFRPETRVVKSVKT